MSIKKHKIFLSFISNSYSHYVMAFPRNLKDEKIINPTEAFGVLLIFGYKFFCNRQSIMVIPLRDGPLTEL